MYTLRSARKVFYKALSFYEKNPHEKEPFKQTLLALDAALEKRERKNACKLARTLKHHMQSQKKGGFSFAFEVTITLFVALSIAIIVRQMAFELFQIPTGSMRPTFKEQDFLSVSKTAFGLNVPLQTDHFLFDPNLVKRGGVIIISGDGLPLMDTKTKFLGILPYTKRYIKRLIGKGGDTLYFYGGKIYGIDKEGNAIQELLDMSLEHIPFMTFEGYPKLTKQGLLEFRHMNMPVGRLKFSRFDPPKGEIYVQGKWKDETTPSSFGHAFGIQNFAMAKLVKGDPVTLELFHHPALASPPPTLFREQNGFDIKLFTHKTSIPLKAPELTILWNHLNTARFVIQDGKATRYSQNGPHFTAHSPSFETIPNGTYEFENGVAKRVFFGGITKNVSSSHSLQKRSDENLIKFFNFGIAFDNTHGTERRKPHRYAYFRDGDLYVMGTRLLTQEQLESFVAEEKKRAENATQSSPYQAFIDPGPPILEDGRLDKERIRAFGLHIPEGHYFVLGDNHAMSSDSRIFGFVPEANLQGVPSFIFWPIGPRFGFWPIYPYSLITLPRIISWSLIIIALLVWRIHHQRKKKRLTQVLNALKKEA